MNIRETTLRADRAQTQCETCPLNRMEAGVVVRIKKLCASPEIQTRLREVGFCEEQIIRLVTTQTSTLGTRHSTLDTRRFIFDSWTRNRLPRFWSILLLCWS